MFRRMAAMDWIMVLAMVLGVVALLAKGPVLAWIGSVSGDLGATLERRSVGRWGMLVASSAFVTAALHSLLRERSLLALLLFLGLVLCWVGDVAGYHGHFVPSVAAFLAGHVLFAAGFSAAGLARPRLRAGAAGVGIASFALGIWFLPHVPPAQKILILGYIVVISLMVVAAWGTKHPNRRLLVLAACLFYVSDIAVAHGKFIPGSRHTIFFCYPLYYPACMLLALGARLRAGR